MPSRLASASTSAAAVALRDSDPCCDTRPRERTPPLPSISPSVPRQRPQCWGRRSRRQRRPAKQRQQAVAIRITRRHALWTCGGAPPPPPPPRRLARGGGGGGGRWACAVRTTLYLAPQHPLHGMDYTRCMSISGHSKPGSDCRVRTKRTHDWMPLCAREAKIANAGVAVRIPCEQKAWRTPFVFWGGWGLWGASEDCPRT
jgi:hypothetical protein